MKPLYLYCLTILFLSIQSFSSPARSNSEYGDILKNTPEYEKITTPKSVDEPSDPPHTQVPHSYPYYRPEYPTYPAIYRQDNPARVGLPGTFYVGISIGESGFGYDDNENGDASIFRFGYRPENSLLGYEITYFQSGKSEVTSLTDIEIQVNSINLALTVNSSKFKSSQVNLIGQGGIYFADTTLTGPFDNVSESSNGFLLAVGIEVALNRHFSLRAEAYNFFDVEDFANDKSISSFSLGGDIIF